MRAMPYLIKRKNVYYAQRKVPKNLEAAVAVVLRQGKNRQAYLLRSLGTDSRTEANIRIKPDRAGHHKQHLHCSDGWRHWISGQQHQRLRCRQQCDCGQRCIAVQNRHWYIGQPRCRRSQHWIRNLLSKLHILNQHNTDKPRLMRKHIAYILAYSAALAVALVALNPRQNANETQEVILKEYLAAFCVKDDRHSKDFVIGTAAAMSRIVVKANLGKLALAEYAKCKVGL
jgi:hypothetical protein